MKKNDINSQIITKLAAKAVLVTRYISDGPGYVGPLLCAIGGGVIQVVMPIIQDTQGNLSLTQLKIDQDFPSIESVLGYEEKYARLVFEHLNEDSKNYCESPDQVDTDRLAIVRWSNGCLGALMFWGETCYVSTFHFEGDRKGDVLFSLEEAREGEFVTRQGVLDALLVAPGQTQNAAEYIERKPSWLVHPDYGFINADDPRVAVQGPENEGEIQ